MSLLNWSILNWSVLNNSLLNWFSLTSLSLTVTLELVCLELVSLELSLMVELEICKKFVVLTRNDPQVSLELPLLNKCHLNGLTIDRRGFQHIYSRIYTAPIHIGHVVPKRYSVSISRGLDAECRQPTSVILVVTVADFLKVCSSHSSNFCIASL